MRPSILIVEQEGGTITRILHNLEHTQAFVASTSDVALQLALREMPSLIILDRMFPNMDAYQLIRKIRDHPKSLHIPLIVVSSIASLTDEIHAYELGADSYIVSSRPDQLLALVRRHLRRIEQSALSPLTRLPSGVQLEHALDYKLQGANPWSLLYLDLDNFKAFNDTYGFLIGNNMILLVSTICWNVVHEFGNSDDLVGHVGGDDFIIVTTPDREPLLCTQITERFSAESAFLYFQEDLDNCSIRGVDRKGRSCRFPLISLSIGVVSCCSCTSDEVGVLAAEAKHHAKYLSKLLLADPFAQKSV